MEGIKMMCIKWVLAGVCLLMAGWLGCSVPDGGDRDELEKAVAALPPAKVSLIRQIAQRQAAIKWLNGRVWHETAAEVHCTVNDMPGTWRTGDLSVEAMIGMLMAGVCQYADCSLIWMATDGKRAGEQLRGLLQKQFPDSTITCKYVWEPVFDPETGDVPDEVTKPDQVGLSRIIEAIISSPTPPPGFPLEELAPLFPTLCPLGAGPGIGCPSTPTDPSGGAHEAAGATSGGA